MKNAHLQIIFHLITFICMSCFHSVGYVLQKTNIDKCIPTESSFVTVARKQNGLNLLQFLFEISISLDNSFFFLICKISLKTLYYFTVEVFIPRSLSKKEQACILIYSNIYFSTLVIFSPVMSESSKNRSRYVFKKKYILLTFASY